MDNQEYNGWYNHATWLVNLHIDNDQGLHESAKGMADGEGIKELVYEVLDINDMEAGFMSDIVFSFIGDVNFNEIFKMMHDDCEKYPESCPIHSKESRS